MCVYQVVNDIYGDGLSVELDELPLHGEYHMAEFAKKYFREAQRNRRSHTHRDKHSQNDLFSQLQKLACIHKHYLVLPVSVHSDQKAKKGKEVRDPTDMIKFSKVKLLQYNSTIVS